ncbi:hypothetical protein KL929_001157 [Ogataea haglerorum]|uniref:Phosphatidylinositol 3-kinase VPS34 n=1 Tax=Ogataea haglerorum TaxID=1937702 RepID=A0ABQ7RKJ2_9ASCO|nr:hypothetical protein KL915_001697 [Ogataea haglerorum]KAG7708203.1 hypothetical protein KL914_001929 [Ogataea haglerorum]KAG7710770.1 hypothetical protein KL950_001683 [Ogataea haglerorum]KAG7721389.1 hypothetical protein KL913_001125 [Ogataea haglerorum]KAG7722143.1 hypothetical protein KL949_001121 [Ogataea haglerorum]
MNYDSKSQNSVSFCLSKDLKLPIRFRINGLNDYTQRIVQFLSPDKHSATSRIIQAKLKDQPISEIYVYVYVESSGKQLTVPVLTSVAYSNGNSKKSSRGNWIDLPIDYSQLPLDAVLVLSLFNYKLKTGSENRLGECRLYLFNQENCTLMKGYQRLKVDFADGETELDQQKQSQMQILEAKLKQREHGEASPVEWLDQLTFRRIEQINAKEAAKLKQQLSITKRTGDVHINLELAQFEIPIVYSDVKYATLNITTSESHVMNAVARNNVSNRDQLLFNEIQSSNLQDLAKQRRPAIFDPDQYRSEIIEDPIESKFRRLERTHQSSSLDKDIKPTLKLRAELTKILHKQFFEKLSQKEKNMIWKYRFFLLNNLILNKNNTEFNNFVINFIKCIDWEDDFEVNEFLVIINNLNTDPYSNVFIRKMEIVDCLELLSANYKNYIVRNMALERLRLASDDDLEMYMVQLVQCIKNEANYLSPRTDIDDDGEEDNNSEENSEFLDFEDSTYTTNSSEFQVINTEDEDPVVKLLNNPNITNPEKKIIEKLPRLQSPLANFLIERSANSERLSNFFYWNLKVEVDDERERYKTAPGNQRAANAGEQTEYAPDQAARGSQVPAKCVKHIFLRTLLHFIANLGVSRNGSDKIWTLRNQVELIGRLHSISKTIKVDLKKDPTQKKIEALKALLAQKFKATRLKSSRKSVSEYESLLDFGPVQLPLDPSVHVIGTIPEESSVFKSSLNPLKIVFKTIEGPPYPIMYKIGDDLRQDQFVIQIMTLVERILLNENLDMKLKPYKIMALGSVEGLIQFIPNSSLSSILQKHLTILSYLQTYNPDPVAPLGVKPEVMDNYVRSCAGYCVLTYILGVGDRHLENLLLTTDGYFFHADFGYILGQDPKPFPPLMKLPIQIIEGMGGLNNENYQKFCNYCFITYITLRKNASLILNIFQLMIDSSIPVLRTSGSNGMSNETEKFELIWKIQEKFMLELNDEEAVLHFQNLINDSVNAFLPVVIDRLHSLAQYWRA